GWIEIFEDYPASMLSNRFTDPLVLGRNAVLAIPNSGLQSGGRGRGRDPFRDAGINFIGQCRCYGPNSLPLDLGHIDALTRHIGRHRFRTGRQKGLSVADARGLSSITSSAT